MGGGNAEHFGKTIGRETNVYRNEENDEWGRCYYKMGVESEKSEIMLIVQVSPSLENTEGMYYVLVYVWSIIYYL